jgi:hypothetical protein
MPSADKEINMVEELWAVLCKKMYENKDADWLLFVRAQLVQDLKEIIEDIDEQVEINKE